MRTAKVMNCSSNTIIISNNSNHHHHHQQQQQQQQRSLASFGEQQQQERMASSTPTSSPSYSSFATEAKLKRVSTAPRVRFADAAAASVIASNSSSPTKNNATFDPRFFPKATNKRRLVDFTARSMASTDSDNPATTSAVATATATAPVAVPKRHSRQSLLQKTNPLSLPTLLRTVEQQHQLRTRSKVAQSEGDLVTFYMRRRRREGGDNKSNNNNNNNRRTATSASNDILLTTTNCGRTRLNWSELLS